MILCLIDVPEGYLYTCSGFSFLLSHLLKILNWLSPHSRICASPILDTSHLESSTESLRVSWGLYLQEHFISGVQNMDPWKSVCRRTAAALYRDMFCPSQNVRQDVSNCAASMKWKAIRDSGELLMKLRYCIHYAGPLKMVLPNLPFLKVGHFLGTEDFQQTNFGFLTARINYYRWFWKKVDLVPSGLLGSPSWRWKMPGALSYYSFHQHDRLQPFQPQGRKPEFFKTRVRALENRRSELRMFLSLLSCIWGSDCPLTYESFLMFVVENWWFKVNVF